MFVLPYGLNGVKQACHSLHGSNIYAQHNTGSFQNIFEYISVLFTDDKNAAQSDVFTYILDGCIHEKEGTRKLMVTWL
jgi:hypothetical protein